jgi:DNA primase
LGTSTTPIHAQKLFRIADTVVFCFDGDEAGRRAAWRALENTLPVLADGKQARFLFLPDGEDPDDAVRRRGKAAFEAMVESAVPLSDFLLAELARRSPPSSAEGRAGLVAAAKPLLAALSAPVLAALLRRRLAEIAGLPEAEMRTLLPFAPVAASRPRATTPGRSTPSLLRDLIKCVLVEPELLRKIDIPRPGEPGMDAEALGALIDFGAASGGPLTTAGVMQHFAGSSHETVLVAALTAAESDGLSGESLETQLIEGVKHYWMMRQRRSALPGDEVPPGGSSVDLSPEEAERARQRRLVQARITGGT